MRNVVSHPQFRSGEAKTTFIDNTPELFEFPRIRDRGNKTMKYIGEITINGFPGIEKQKPFYNDPRIPQQIETLPDFVSAKTILDTQGADGVIRWINQQKMFY